MSGGALDARDGAVPAAARDVHSRFTQRGGQPQVPQVRGGLVAEDQCAVPGGELPRDHQRAGLVSFRHAQSRVRDGQAGAVEVLVRQAGCPGLVQGEHGREQR